MENICLYYVYSFDFYSRNCKKENSVSDYIANETIMAFLNASWNDVAPFLLDYNYTVHPKLKVNVSQRIRNFYIAGDDTPNPIPGKGDISVKNWEKLVTVSI